MKGKKDDTIPDEDDEEQGGIGTTDEEDEMEGTDEEEDENEDDEEIEDDNGEEDNENEKEDEDNDNSDSDDGESKNGENQMLKKDKVRKDEGSKNQSKKRKRTAVDDILDERNSFLSKTKSFNDLLKKRGVVYISRIPPRMTPTKLKQLLSVFGEITRVYLAEEDATKRKQRRRQNGGNSGGKRYTEGWVEFVKKKVAKHVAASLNNTRISNQKRNHHYDDLWALKYLHHFKWSHLTEKVAYERRVREQKLRIEMMQAKKENASYVQLVETGKKLDQIEQRQQKHRVVDKSNTNDNHPESREQQKKHKKQRRHRQIKPIHDGMDKASNRALLGSLV